MPRILREQGITAVQGLSDEAVAPPAVARRVDRAEPDAPEIDVGDYAPQMEEADEGDEDGIAVAPVPHPLLGRTADSLPRPVAFDRRATDFGHDARVEPAMHPPPARGLSDSDAARLHAALDDLTACKKLVDDALAAGQAELFSLK